MPEKPKSKKNLNWLIARETDRQVRGPRDFVRNSKIASIGDLQELRSIERLTMADAGDRILIGLLPPSDTMFDMRSSALKYIGLELKGRLGDRLMFWNDDEIVIYK